MVPRSTKGDVVELPCELFGFLNPEGTVIGAPGSSEEVDGRGDELLWHANGHAAQVKDEAQDPVDWG